MKKIYACAVTLFLLFTAGLHAQTTLVAGDIAIVGYNANGAAGNDDFSFLLLTGITSGTTINFTDFGWCSGAGSTGFQTANSCGASTGALSDGAVTWTSSSDLPCGTQVRIQCQNNLSASSGTVTGLQASFNIPADYMSLVTGGDQIFAFQGTLAAPALITGINMNGGWDATLAQCAFTASLSTLPAALDATNTLVVLPEVNNAAYNGAVVSASPANLLSAIYNNANWLQDDLNPFTLPLAYAFDCNACVPPSVTVHPVDHTICPGANTTFSVTAAGSGISYQWQVDDGSGFTDIVNGTFYTNATTDVLTISGAVAAMNGYVYRCTITGNCGTENSEDGSLTISMPGTTGSQTDITCNEGMDGTATVIPSGGVPPYTYSWSPSGGTGAIAGGLSANTYTVTVTDDVGCQVNRNYTLAQPAPVQVAAPADNSICAGSSAGLIAIAIGGTPGYTYQWQPGNLDGSAQTVSPDTTIPYIVTATDAAGCTGRDTVTITVFPNLALAALNGGSTPGNTTSTGSQVNSGLESFYNGDCSLIASVEQDPALGNITASVTVIDTIPVADGRPYVARWYEIIPQHNGAAQVTLYFKQNDFDLYNTYAALHSYPLLPQGPADQDGIDTLVITKVSGGTLGVGTASLIEPGSVVWDATKQYWKVTFETPSFSEFYIHAGNATGTPLPVGFSAFEVRRERGSAILSWSTASEHNNAGFTIERSTDGKQFTALGTRTSKAKNGNSTQPLLYYYTDLLPAPGINYYRLQQKDRDDRISYSVIRSLNFGNNGSFTCYPNPASELLTIEHEVEETVTVEVRLTDVTGRLMRRQVVNMHKGFNKNTLQLSGLSQGIYHLTIKSNEKTLFRSSIVKK